MSAGVDVPGQQPGETWEEFQDRVAVAVMGMVAEANDPNAPEREDPPLIKFLKRREAGFPKK